MVEQVDLSGSWKFQLRDRFGRWAKESGGIGGIPSAGPAKYRTKFDPQFHRVERARTSTVNLPGFKSTTTTSSSHTEARYLTKDEVRHTLTMDEKHRDMLFEAAGLKGEYKDDEVSLIHRLHNTKDPSEKDKIVHELDTRLKAISVGLATYQQADLLARREQKRNYFKKFDAHLAASKMGKALLKIRDSILSDKAFDRAGAAKDKAKEWGKDWGKELATNRLVAMLVSAGTGLAVHGFGASDELPETVQHFLENPAAETAVASAVAMALVLIGKVVKSRGQKAEQKAAAKAQAYRLRGA